MADILIQFHALPNELSPLVEWAVTELAVHVTAFRFHPFEALEMRSDTVDSFVEDSSIRELAFTLDVPPSSVTTEGEFLDRYPSALLLSIGRRTDKGLEESCLSTRTNDERALEIWKKVARRLRQITQTGAIAVNSATGATSKQKAHRFTNGAKALDDAGVTILPVAGATVLHLGQKFDTP